MAWGLDFLVAASSALILTAAVLLLSPLPARVARARAHRTFGRDAREIRAARALRPRPNEGAAEASR